MINKADELFFKAYLFIFCNIILLIYNFLFNKIHLKTNIIIPFLELWAMGNLFAIVDLETTGGRADQERIIEVAVALHDGEKIIDRFESLINPERSIPYNITRITGISTKMVANAPKFFEVAKRIVEITEGAVFVAHNVRFDYSFLTYEFKRLGYTYTRKQLCTVKMSRKAFPKLEGGHSLGNLIKQFDIEVKDRHRAMADVVATVDVFERIIKLNGGTDFDTMMKQGIKEAKLPQGLTLEKLEVIPNETGVYYFYNEAGDVVYVGKSIHIKRRIFEHFRGRGNKANLMERHVRDVSYVLTGSELISLLLESHEIRRLQPIINKAQRGKGSPTGILCYENQEGYLCFRHVKLTTKNKNHSGIIAQYDKASIANMAMFRAKMDFELCGCLLDGKKGENSCIYQQIGQCEGAGVTKESKEEYNKRANAAKERLTAAYDYDCFIIDRGRVADEKSVVLIENGTYQGFGYINNQEGYTLDELRECIERQPNNSNIPGIIRTFISSSKNLKIIRLG